MLETNLTIKKTTESSVTDYSGEEPVVTVNEIRYQVMNNDTPLGEVRVTSNGFSISAFGFQDAITQDIDAIVTKMFNAVKA